MQEFPHHYQVNVKAEIEGELAVSAQNLPSLSVTPPAQFGGPGDHWSPEDLLMASVASCFVLSFRAIARASKLDWLSLNCESQGELDRIDRVTRFTSISTSVRLSIPAGQSESKAERLLKKAEESCLITNSMSAVSSLEFEVIVEQAL